MLFVSIAALVWLGALVFSGELSPIGISLALMVGAGVLDCASWDYGSSHEIKHKEGCE
jgi:hypothetical protein